MNAAVDTAPQSKDGLDAQAWKIIGVIILAPFMTQIDSTVVNVSLSAIARHLNAAGTTGHRGGKFYAETVRAIVGRLERGRAQNAQ